MLYQMPATIFFLVILSQRSSAVNTSLEALQEELANSFFSEKHSRPGAAKVHDLFYVESVSNVLPGYSGCLAKDASKHIKEV